MGESIQVTVIFATYNRASIIESVLENWKKIDKKTKYSYEIICSDDASSDNTVELIKAEKKLPIIVLENEHGGASKARNAALKIARGEIVIFTGDDIFPCEEFVNLHYENYVKYGSKVATLGKLDWHPEIPMNHLMQHITNIGCEQFGFAGLTPYALTDFRHFYTSNISVARSELNQLDEFFSLAFDRYGYEDIELGYRLQKNGVFILYDPDITGYHHHIYDDVEKFCKRQLSAGNQMVVFAGLHKNLSNDIGFGIEEFECAMKDYVKEHGCCISLRGLDIFRHIVHMKKRTIEIENMLKNSINEYDANQLRKECSACYRYVFQFYMYLGWAERVLKEKGWVSKYKIAEAVADYLHSGHVQVFWDTGNGINETESLKWNRVGTHVHKIVDVKDAVEVRVDPLDDQCILKRISVKAISENGNEDELKEFYVNGVPMEDGGYDFSGNIDPNVLYRNIPKNTNQLEIDFNIKILTQIKFIDIVMETIKEELDRVQDYSLEVKQPIRIHLFVPEKMKKKSFLDLQRRVMSEFPENVSISNERTFRPGYASYYLDYNETLSEEDVCMAIKKLMEAHYDGVKTKTCSLKSFIAIDESKNMKKLCLIVEA